MQDHQYHGLGTFVSLVCPWEDGSGFIPPPTLFFHGLGSLHYVDTTEDVTRIVGIEVDNDA